MEAYRGGVNEAGIASYWSGADMRKVRMQVGEAFYSAVLCCEEEAGWCNPFFPVAHGTRL